MVDCVMQSVGSPNGRLCGSKVEMTRYQMTLWLSVLVFANCSQAAHTDENAFHIQDPRQTAQDEEWTKLFSYGPFATGPCVGKYRASADVTIRVDAPLGGWVYRDRHSAERWDPEKPLKFRLNVSGTSIHQPEGQQTHAVYAFSFPQPENDVSIGQSLKFDHPGEMIQFGLEVDKSYNPFGVQVDVYINGTRWTDRLVNERLRDSVRCVQDGTVSDWSEPIEIRQKESQDKIWDTLNEKNKVSGFKMGLSPVLVPAGCRASHAVLNHVDVGRDIPYRAVFFYTPDGYKGAGTGEPSDYVAITVDGMATTSSDCRQRDFFGITCSRYETAIDGFQGTIPKRRGLHLIGAKVYLMESYANNPTLNFLCNDQ